MYAQVFFAGIFAGYAARFHTRAGGRILRRRAGERFGLFRNKTDAVVFCCMQAQLKGAEKDFMFDSK